MKILFQTVLGFCCVAALLASCSTTSQLVGTKEVQAPLAPLSCIVALPAGTSVNSDDTLRYDEAKNLAKGAAFATTVLHKELGGNPQVRIINDHQVATLAPEVSGGLTGTVAAIGEKVNCEGVLVTTVRRFQQRQGSSYAVDSPASVDVQLVLFHAEKGTVLWSAELRETQESFLENIFSFSKMQERGFKWITVEQLVEQGMRQRLAECPYLN